MDWILGNHGKTARRSLSIWTIGCSIVWMVFCSAGIARPSSGRSARESSGILWKVSGPSLLRSHDGGRSWESRLLPDVQAVPRRVWSLQPDAPIFVDTIRHGLYRSTNGGASFQPSSQGLPHSIGAAAIAPVLEMASGSASPNIVYLATEVHGIYRSDNSGLTWTAASNGLPVPLSHRTRAPLLAVDSGDAQWIYAVITIPVHSELQKTTLFRSSDGGRNWIPVKRLRRGEVYSSMKLESSRRILLKGRHGVLRIADVLEKSVPIRRTLPQQNAMRTFTSSVRPLLADRDRDGVAILHDDGTLVFRSFDLDQKSLEFRPNGPGGYDFSTGESRFQSSSGTSISLDDDDSVYLSLPFPFKFYGINYTSFFVNSNGGISFRGPESNGYYSQEDFLGGNPRIAAIWADLDPSAGGRVSVDRTPDQVAVTWERVPDYYETAELNTFQIILKPDGAIQIHYSGVALKEGITGLSNGGAARGQLVSFSLSSQVTGVRKSAVYQMFYSTPEMNPLAASQKFYQSHDDDYDALIVVGASNLSQDLAGSGIVSYSLGIRNDTMGIGLATYNYAGEFGSLGKLQSFINLNSLSFYPADFTEVIGALNHSTLTLLGEEWGHRFLAFPAVSYPYGFLDDLLGREYSHWNFYFDTDASVMEGNRWNSNSDGSFSPVENSHRYGRLDQYLMGLRPPEDVGTMRIITEPEPILKGPIESLVSTFGMTDNAVKDLGQNFGSPDRLLFFGLDIGDSSPGFASMWYLSYIQSSGCTDLGPDPTVISTYENLADWIDYLDAKVYAVRMPKDAQPAARYYDPITEKFTGDLLSFRGVERAIEINNIIEIEGERFPSWQNAQKSFRHAFVLLTAPGDEATEEDIQRVAALRRAWETFYSDATEKLGAISTGVDFGLSRVSETIDPSGGRVYGSMAGDTIHSGYARLDPAVEPASGMAILASKAGENVIGEAAIPASAPLIRGFCYAEKSGIVNTGLAITSPLAAATLTLELRDSAGHSVAAASWILPKGGKIGRFLHELFPNYSFPADFKGSLSVNASSPVALVALRTVLNQKDEFLITSLPVIDLDAVQPSSPLYLSQIVDAGGYVTQVMLSNPGESVLTGTIEFHQPDGKPWPLKINGDTAEILFYRLEPHGTQVLKTAGDTGSARNGYLVLHSDAQQRPPVVGAVFSLTQNDVLTATTGMAAAAVLQSARIYVDETGQHDTGLGLVNPGSTAVTVQLTVKDLDGTAIRPPVSFALGGKEQKALFLSSFVADLPESFCGVLEMTAEIPIAALALRATDLTDRFLMATLPIESMTPAPVRTLYMPHIADGPGYYSQFVILNTGASAASPTLSFYSEDGSPLHLVSGQ
jgi:hypothetical protein